MPRKSVCGGLVMGLLVTTRTVRADESLVVACDATCAIDREPALHTPVVITVETTGAHHGEIVVPSLRGPVECAAPCALAWPGRGVIRIRLDGHDVDLVERAAPRPRPGEIPFPTIAADHRQLGTFVAPSPLTDLLAVDSLAQLDIRAIDGPNRQEVPYGQKIERAPTSFTTLVGPGSEVIRDDSTKVEGPHAMAVLGGVGPAQGSGAVHVQVESSAQGMDRSPEALEVYFDDVVLVDGPGIGCSGIAIGPRAVLTAGHCAVADRIRVVRPGGKLVAFQVTRRDLPPDAGLDLVVLRVTEDLSIPVRPRVRRLDASPPTHLARLVGFGTNDRAASSGFGVKRQALLSIDDWSCDGRRAERTGCSPGAEIVISTAQADTCAGDSGGPVLEVVGKQSLLAAITSRGVPGARTACGGGGIYTSVAPVAEWLDEEARR